MEPRTIFHVDMDAFFASIEVKDNPQLAGKPVIVCGDPTGRSVVTSPTYEARPFGIRAGMAVSEARRRCPKAIFVPGDHKKYIRHSLLLQKTLLSFTPDMEPWSIDEAFLDMTYIAKSPEAALDYGRRIKAAIRENVGTTGTVGIGMNKLVAKLASKVQKPDGLTMVRAEATGSFVAALPVGKLWGIGEKFEAALNRIGIRMVADVLPIPLEKLKEIFGVGGEALYLKVRGLDDSPVIPFHAQPDAKSIGHEITFDKDVFDANMIMSVLSTLSDRVAVRLREQKARARTVTLKLRTPNFITRTRRVTLYEPTDYDGEIFLAATAAWNRFAADEVEFEEDGPQLSIPFPRKPGGGGNYINRRDPIRLSRIPLRKGIRLIGISVSDLHEQGSGQQATMFVDVEARQGRISSALDRIRDKYGNESIARARSGGGVRAARGAARKPEDEYFP